MPEECPCRDAAELRSHRVEFFEQVIVRERLIVLRVPVDPSKALQFGPASLWEKAINVVLLMPVIRSKSGRDSGP